MAAMRITKAQKRILQIVGVVGLAFVIFVAFVYLPQRRLLRGLKEDVRAGEAEVNQIKAVAGEEGSLEGAIRALNERLNAFNSAFPDKEEVILRELSGLMSRLGMKVGSLRPHKKAVIGAIGEMPVSIAGCVVQEMHVSVTATTSYATLGEFFKTVKKEFPIVIMIDTVMMRRDGKDRKSGLLNVEIGLNSYLITPQTS